MVERNCLEDGLHVVQVEAYTGRSRDTVSVPMAHTHCLWEGQWETEGEEMQPELSDHDEDSGLD